MRPPPPLLPSLPFPFAVNFAMASPTPTHRVKRRRLDLPPPPHLNDLADELLFLILDRAAAHDPRALKSFSLVSRACHAAESRHRRVLRPFRPDLLPAALARYSAISRLDLSLCPRLPDAALAALPAAPSVSAVDLSRSRGFGAAGLAALVAACPNLTDLDLSNGLDLGDAAAAEVAKARRLQRLSLSRCKRITDMGLGCIAVGCPDLRELSLKWCIGVTHLGLDLLALKCNKLNILDLSYTMIVKKCFPAIMKLQNLQVLLLVGCNGIDDDALTSLDQECSKSLQVLDMSNSYNVTHVGVLSIVKAMPYLLELNLSYCSPVTPSMSSSFEMIHKLQTLKLDGCQFMDDGLKSIGKSCVSLRELSLSKCSGVTDTDLSFVVPRLKNLLKLDVTCCRKITDVSLAAITTSCPSLISLRMESCSLVSSKGLQLIGRRCTHLEELDLTDTDLDDEGLKALSGCSKLSSLKIGICLRITDEGLRHVSKSCPDLRDIDLYRSGAISDEGVTHIAQGCPMLESINLSYCTKLTDSSLRSLSKCIKLNTLEIRGCPMVSSAGLLEIATGCRLLSKLDIKKCFEINDMGMIFLSQFSHNLRQINLSYCSVTDIGLISLSSICGLQNMTIVHLAGVTPNGLIAALMVCGLRKVKLHEAFKSMVPSHMLKVVEARGCLFQWINKPYQDTEFSSFGGRKKTKLIDGTKKKRERYRSRPQWNQVPFDGSHEEPMPLPNPMVGFSLPNDGLRFGDALPPAVQKSVLEECRKWNLVWVGKNKVATLEPDEMEFLLGYPRNHTRGVSRTARYRALGNSFQIDTVAYHLSVLRDIFPNGMNVLSLFSGIGRAEVALHRLGIRMKTVVSVEISEVNMTLLRSWWDQTQTGTLIKIADVQNLTAERIELFIRRFGPCNNLAGSNRYHRDGLEGKHSALFYHYYRILDSKLLEAYKNTTPPPKTPADAAQLIARALDMIQRVDLEVYDKCIGDGDGFTAYVSTTDPRESANVPLEVHELVIARTQARKCRDYQSADALLSSLDEAGYKIISCSDDEVLARKYRIRMRGIDAPELKMPYGKESRNALVKLIGGKSVKIYVYDLDQFGRYVGDIHCNNLFIQEQMLKNGHAWHFKTYDKRPEFARINLSYCSVTDIGLISLSSICGLQNMTIVHLAGVTPNGLLAALMVCGLRKVKLHEAFKSMVPSHMLKVVEARGCLFQWINKPYQVAVEPCDVWKQQSQDLLVQ
uniref:TNase-like domain-containing protein n=1 Tax=Oryza meridionalis TaxID=40149 RepID=A0A0E0F1N4_9ORYZ